MPSILTLVLLPLALGACTPLHVSRTSTTHDLEALGTSSELFGRSLRWSDLDAASAVLQESEPRLAFLERWTASPPVQITDYEIVHLELATEGTARPEGLVVVKVERIRTGTAVVSVDMIRQTWYREADHWYLEAGSVPYGDE
jgi:hypothetical protein